MILAKSKLVLAFDISCKLQTDDVTTLDQNLKLITPEIFAHVKFKLVSIANHLYVQLTI